MPGISYDESGSLAGYFGVTCLTLVLLPWSYFTFQSRQKAGSHTALCPCPECKKAPQRVDKIKRSTRKSSGIKRLVLLVSAWALLGYLIYNLAISSKSEGATVYNPFEILGLSTSSTEKEIKKHYKKLSLQFHPDKLKLSENQTQEEADSKYIELTKAYKSLTDETTRENLAKYGNPDGPQQREDKIAIPKWIVEGSNGLWVLAVYGLVLGGGIPWVVGRWWFTQRRLTRDNILNATAEHFFHGLSEDSDFTNLIALLAGSLEITAVLKSKSDKKTKKANQIKVEELENIILKRKDDFAIEDDLLMKKENRVAVTSGTDRRARALLWAHILRIDIEDPALRADQLAVLRVLPPLLAAMNSIALAHNWLTVTLRAIELQPSLVQALHPDVHALAQLPGIDPEQAYKQSVTKGAEGRLWLEKWIRTREGLDEAFAVAKYWPRLEVVDAKFTVTDSKIVTPGSIVTLVAKLRYVYPTTPLSARAKPVQMLPPSEHAKQQEVLKGLAGVSVDVKEDGDQKKKEKVEEKVTEEVVEPNGYAHAPRWPQLRKPHFYFLLGDSKLNKVIVPPVKITDIPLPSPDGTPSAPKEFKLQFQAPPAANLYSFIVFLRSDTYLGGDVRVPLMLKIEEPQAEEYSSDDDISEPEEDSLAGQMAIMRGEKVKPSGVRSRKNEYDSSSDEYDEASSSEGEEDEAPKRQRAYNEDSSDSD